MPSSKLIETKLFIFLNMFYYGFRTWWISWDLHLDNFTVRNKRPIEAASYSVQKRVLKNFTNFTGKHLCQSRFLIKLQALHDPNTGVFLWNLWNFEEYHFYRTHSVAASWSSCCFIGRRISLRQHETPLAEFLYSIL